MSASTTEGIGETVSGVIRKAILERRAAGKTWKDVQISLTLEAIFGTLEQSAKFRNLLGEEIREQIENFRK
jgi:hypothetical protein